jgi:uncharacterized membrane protein
MKILLFNQNPVVEKLVVLSAQKTKDELIIAGSTDELINENFDLLLLDDDSFITDNEVLEEIKERVTFTKSCLITSQDSTIEDREFDETLQKPFLPTDLVEILDKFHKNLNIRQEDDLEISPIDGLDLEELSKLEDDKKEDDDFETIINNEKSELKKSLGIEEINEDDFLSEDEFLEIESLENNREDELKESLAKIDTAIPDDSTELQDLSFLDDIDKEEKVTDLDLELSKMEEKPKAEEKIDDLDLELSKMEEKPKEEKVTDLDFELSKMEDLGEKPKAEEKIDDLDLELSKMEDLGEKPKAEEKIDDLDFELSKMEDLGEKPKEEKIDDLDFELSKMEDLGEKPKAEEKIEDLDFELSKMEDLGETIKVGEPESIDDITEDDLNALFVNRTSSKGSVEEVESMEEEKVSVNSSGDLETIMALLKQLDTVGLKKVLDGMEVNISISFKS